MTNEEHKTTWKAGYITGQMDASREVYDMCNEYNKTIMHEAYRNAAEQAYQEEHS